MKAILNDKGMTLVELMFATLLMAFVLIALVTLMMGAITAAGFAKTQTRATALANEKIETVRGMNYSDIGIYGSTNPEVPEGTLPSTHTTITRGTQSFEYWYEVAWIDDSADGSGGADSDGDTHDYKRVTVYVSWSESPNSTIKVDTNIREKESSSEVPTVEFISPTPDSMTVVTDGDSPIGLGATASDNDGQIISMRFYFGGHCPEGASFNTNDASVTKYFDWDMTEINPDTEECWYADGALEVKVQVWDNAGANSYRIIYLVIDNEAPVFATSTPLSAEVTSYDTATLTWTAATDGTDRVEYYNIYRSTDGVNWTKTSVGPSEAIYNPTTDSYTYNITGLSAWSNYQFYIEARSPLNVQNGTGGYLTASNTDTGNMTLIKLTGSWSRSGPSYRNNLSWTSPPGGVTCTGYDIYRNGSYYTSTTSTSYTDTSVSRWQTYTYQIKAKNGSEVINTSNQISITTGS